MIITRQQLEAELAQLTAERDELAARLNARIGGINVLSRMLGVLDLPDSATQEGKGGTADVAQAQGAGEADVE